jgi:hypothetical protein
MFYQVLFLKISTANILFIVLKVPSLIHLLNIAITSEMDQRTTQNEVLLSVSTATWFCCKFCNNNNK